MFLDDYPFGLKMKGFNNVVASHGNSVAQKFGYNGIELEESLGLNLHEMDFRQYDATIGRFTAIDPITHHSQSTYTAFDNNPIYWADPSGADAIGGLLGGEYSEKTPQSKFNISNDLPQNVASTVVNNDGVVIDYQNDGDDNIYLNTRDEENIIGQEREGALYEIGKYLRLEDLNEDAFDIMPSSFRIEEEVNNTSELLGTALVLSQADSPAPGPGDILAGIVLIKVAYDYLFPSTTLEFAKTKPGKEGEVDGAEHKSGARKSTRRKHEQGQTRKQQKNRDKKRQNSKWRQNPNKRK